MKLSIDDPDLNLRLSNIRLLILDVDGVLTDGVAYYDEHGVAMKGFSMRDGFPLIMAKFAGIQIGIITGDLTGPIRARMKKFKIEMIKGGHFRKTVFFDEILSETGIPEDQACFIGDDVFDIPVMQRCGISMAPEDANEDVLEIADIIVPVPGGRGVVREAVRAILNAKGVYNDVLRQIQEDEEGGV